MRQQHDRVWVQARVVGAGQRDLAADDRLDALPRAILGEFEGAEEVAGVGDGDRRHMGVFGQGRELVHADRALAEGVGGMGAEVDEICVGHGGSLAGCGESGEAGFSPTAPTSIRGIVTHAQARSPLPRRSGRR